MNQETQTEAPAPVPSKGGGSKVLWIILIIIVVLIALGAGGCYLAGSWVKNKAEDIEEEVGTIPEVGEGNTYDEATAVDPTSEIGIALNTNFSTIFETVFGGSKLITVASDESYETLGYVVARVITVEDAKQIKNLLEAEEYETTSSNAGTDTYNYQFTATILGEEYENILVTIYLGEESDYNFQRISVMLYK